MRMAEARYVALVLVWCEDQYLVAVRGERGEELYHHSQSPAEAATRSGQSGCWQKGRQG